MQHCERRNWLMKSEPDSYSIDHLAKEGKTPWSGVRNYQARNNMRDLMTIGDKILFHHSSTAQPAIVGIGEVCSAPYPDPTQFDKKSPYYDPKSTKDKPTWMLVDICFIEKFKRPVTLEELKSKPFFSDMVLTQRGSRLSIQPVEKKHFDKILTMQK